MPARIAALMDERKKLERELSDAKKKLAMGGGTAAGEPGADVRQVNGVKLLAARCPALSSRICAASPTRASVRSAPASSRLSATAEDGKAGIVVGVTDDLTKRFNAVDLVRKGAEALGGKGGGGRPDMAQAGGPGRLQGRRRAQGD